MLNYPEPLKKIIQCVNPDINNGPWITGGSVINWYRGNFDTVQDIDIYFKNQEQVENLYTKIVDNFIIEKSIKLDTSLNLFLVSENTNYHLQLIHRGFYNSWCAVAGSFDISVCKIFTDGKQYFLSDQVRTHIETGRFSINFDTANEKILSRFLKYIGKGFFPYEDTVQQLESFCEENSQYGLHSILSMTPTAQPLLHIAHHGY